MMKHDKNVLMHEIAAVINSLIKQGRIQQTDKDLCLSAPDMLCFGVIIYELGIEMGEMKQEIRNLGKTEERQRKTAEYQKYALKVAEMFEAKLRDVGGLKGYGSPH